MHQLSLKFIKIITYILLIVAFIFITFQTIELLWESFQNFFTRFTNQGIYGLNYNPEYGKKVLVLFFNVLLGLELLESIKVFNEHHTIKVRTILLICLIAASRKIFVMDDGHHEVMEYFGVAGLILSLALSYFFVSKQTLVEQAASSKKQADDTTSKM